MNVAITKWGKFIGIDEAAEPSDLIGLFQEFRPDGIGVEQIFSDHAFGDKVLTRLLYCYQCTRSGILPGDVYFIPRPPEPPSVSEAKDILFSHLMKMKQLADHRGDKELSKILSEVSPVQVGLRSELNEIPFNDNSPEGWLYDLSTNFIGSLMPQHSELILLKDAFYSIANNLFVRNYILWPLYEQSSPIDDPFLHSFELWSRGISYSFRSPHSCRYWIYKVA